MSRRLESLTWIVPAVTETSPASIEVAYALDTLYVYRRQRNLADSSMEPQYARATHQAVLRNDNDWGDIQSTIWEPVDEMGRSKQEAP